MIVSKLVAVVVMFKYGLGLRDLEYSHPEEGIIICALLINNQYASNMHANKQLVNSE